MKKDYLIESEACKYTGMTPYEFYRFVKESKYQIKCHIVGITMYDRRAIDAALKNYKRSASLQREPKRAPKLQKAVVLNKAFPMMRVKTKLGGIATVR